MATDLGANDRQWRELVDRQLERALVGSTPSFATDATASALIDIVGAEQFEDDEARRYWRVIEELVAERGWFVLQNVLERAERSVAQWEAFRKGAGEVVGREELYRHAHMVEDLAARRKLLLIGRGLTSNANNGQLIVEDMVKTIQDQLIEVKSTVADVKLPRTLRDIRNDPPEMRWNWAVEGWLEFKDRIMITGAEGGGKMTILRQFAVQLGLGFHPWMGPDKFEPLIGLTIDLQDGKVRNEREFDIICDRARVDPFDHLFIESRDSGINVVRSAADRRWLEGLIRKTRPHFVVIGPIYKMASGEDPTDAVAMQLLIDFIEKMRSKYDVIWFIEAHSPAAAAVRAQSWRPFGSQRFLAWPDAGYGLMPDGRSRQRVGLREWRGNRDLLTKSWPKRLAWGEYWPFVDVEVRHPMLKHRPPVKGLPAPSDGDPGATDKDEGMW